MINFFKGLIIAQPGNRVSSTKFWNAVGMIVMSGMFIYMGVEKEIPEWMGWAFVFMITPSRLMKNLIDLRWGKSAPSKDEDK